LVVEDIKAYLSYMAIAPAICEESSKQNTTI